MGVTMEKIYDKHNKTSGETSEITFTRIYETEEEFRKSNLRKPMISDASEEWVKRNPVGTRSLWYHSGLARGHSICGYHKNIEVNMIPGEVMLQEVTSEHHMVYRVVTKITPKKKRAFHAQEYEVEETYEWGMVPEKYFSTSITYETNEHYNPTTIVG